VFEKDESIANASAMVNTDVLVKARASEASGSKIVLTGY
jgi:hypothetical protein